MRIQRAFLIVAVLLIAQPGPCRVLIRWTDSSLPRTRLAGANELVIPWSRDRTPVMADARKQGYRVYVEADASQANAAAEAAGREGLAGIIVKAPGDGPLSDAPAEAKHRASYDTLVNDLRGKYPRLEVRLLWPGGKEPQMRGSMVVERNGLLQVSSPTAQPWIDSNVALIRFERTYDPAERPLVEFTWDLTDTLEQEYGPPPEDYELAVAEAGAFGADLILPLHKHLEDGLAQGKPEALKAWLRIEKYLEFYSARDEAANAVLMSNVAVVTNDYGSSYEAINLMARHNIPFRVVRPADFESGQLESADLIAVFSSLDARAAQAVEHYAATGRTAVLVGQEGNFPWRAGQVLSKTADATVYAVGKGKVVEVAAPLIDPEPFARDIWRLLPAEERELSVWNGLTILAAAYQPNDAASARLELVNYAERNLRTQVRIKGSFSRILYETPEDGCCVSLAASRNNGFTEFVVPKLGIGGRIRLSTR